MEVELEILEKSLEESLRAVMKLFLYLDVKIETGLKALQATTYTAWSSEKLIRILIQLYKLRQQKIKTLPLKSTCFEWKDADGTHLEKGSVEKQLDSLRSEARTIGIRISHITSQPYIIICEKYLSLVLSALRDLLKKENKLSAWKIVTAIITDNKLDNDRCVELLEQALRESMNAIDIAKIMDAFTPTMNTTTDGQDVIVPVGTTGVGKSTTIHFMVGKLKYKETQGICAVDFKGKDLVKDVIIGGGVISVTKRSTSINLNDDRSYTNYKLDKSIYLWDAPGFGDTAGKHASIANALKLTVPLRLMGSVRLLVLLSVFDLGAADLGRRLFLLRNIQN